MSDLTRLTAVEVAGAVASGEASAVEVAQAHLDRIATVDDRVGAFLFTDADGALAAARAVDERRAAGERLGPLAGVPLALKDILTTKGVPTTCGSRILEGWRPPYDATVVTRLRDAGVVVLGKVNLDEFAMGSTTENSAYRVTRNPWDLERVPGGSSGGSSAAVAAFEATISIGTDTGGSVRQPAAYCGLVGAKPTYGTVSRYGLVAFSSSLDQAGPLGRTVLDTALLHEAVAGHDPRDGTSLDEPVRAVVAAAREGARGDLSGTRVGVVRELHGEGFDPGVEQRFTEALETLRGLGAEILEVGCPHFPYAIGAYYLIAPSEASSNLARFDAMRFGLRVGDDGVHGVDDVMSLTRQAGFGPEVKRRIILGTYALSAGYYDAYYGQAEKVRTLIARDFAGAFRQVDVLVCPTAPTTAYRIGEKVDDPVAMYRGDVSTLPVNLAGVPALSVPCGLSPDDGLPVGLQIMSPTLADERGYRVAAALEAAQDAARGGALLAAVPELEGVPA
jgi:aspartyl-tRNA(Asn)/glutamyl-tRNA(Gln) amidotransferase subunit A